MSRKFLSFISVTDSNGEPALLAVEEEVTDVNGRKRNLRRAMTSKQKEAWKRYMNEKDLLPIQVILP